jgi:hypothetical protein
MFMGGNATQWEATYGTVRYFTISEVSKIFEALSSIREYDLQFSLDNLFKSHETRIDMESLFIKLYTQLINFFSEATQQGDIILVSFD